MALERILYVEDEPIIQEIARMALELVGGYTINVCSSGQEALDAIESFAPQLVMLDVMMPGMNGPTTMQKVREIPSMNNVPVVFMTAKAEPDDVEYYKSLGAIGVIPKPFDPMELSAQVNAIWEACQAS